MRGSLQLYLSRSTSQLTRSLRSPPSSISSLVNFPHFSITAKHGQTPLDIFALLPGPVWPVLATIFVHLEDLASVYSLYRSSPTVFSSLREDGTARRVIEAIMDERVTRRTQIPSRKFALLRWNTWPAIDTDDFILTYIKDDTTDNRIPQGIPVSVLCDVLAASAISRYLTHAGMHEMIARCTRLELLHLKAPS